MKYAVEVVHLVAGELVSMRRLSAARERAGATLAVLTVGLLSVGAMALGAVVVRTLGRAIYVPWFIAVWVAAAVGLSVLAVSLVRGRLRRYVLGSRLESDAYSPVDVDLVRRSGNRFDLTIVPGMSGYVESGRAPLPVEALVNEKPRTVTLGDCAVAELSLGTATFIVRSRAVLGAAEGAIGAERSGWAGPRADGNAGESPTREVPFSRDFLRLFSRPALIGIQVALAGTLFCAVPLGQTIGDRPAHLIAPRITTPWEAEKWLRIEAQLQSRSLHQCFDPLPLACQHSGYVGVGVSLARDGEVRSNWIARSTYGADCPVDRCIKDVVSTWVFDPLPEPMRVVLPVQVLRTDKPLPPKIADARVAEARVDSDEDASVQWTRGR